MSNLHESCPDAIALDGTEDPYDVPAFPDSYGEGDHLVVVEPISLHGISPERVVQALIKGAMTSIQTQDALDGKPPHPFPGISLKILRSELQKLKACVPKAAYPDIMVSGEFWSELPDLCGLRPFAGVIPVETIMALNDQYGEDFTQRCLSKLVNGRDREAVQAEYGKRLREGLLYIGDIPFPIWYASLQQYAAAFIQSARQASGRTGLPDDISPIDFTRLNSYVAQHEAQDLAFPIRSRTGLPIMTSHDTDIDAATINKTFKDMGYPVDREFVADALYRVLAVANRKFGPVRRRPPTPAPESPEQQQHRVAALLEQAAAASVSDSGIHFTAAYENSQTDTMALTTSGGETRERLRPSIVSAPLLDCAPQTPNIPQTGGSPNALHPAAEDSDSTAPTTLKPSQQTQARIQRLEHRMNYEFWPLKWTLYALPLRCCLKLWRMSQLALGK